MDLFDTKIVGWALSTDMTTEATVLAAWRMAVLNRPITQLLIFHSDRGVQFTSLRNCWDNAVAENYFKILKSEMVNHSKPISILSSQNRGF